MSESPKNCKITKNSVKLQKYCHIYQSIVRMTELLKIDNNKQQLLTQLVKWCPKLPRNWKKYCKNYDFRQFPPNRSNFGQPCNILLFLDFTTDSLLTVHPQKTSTLKHRDKQTRSHTQTHKKRLAHKITKRNTHTHTPT